MSYRTQSIDTSIEAEQFQLQLLKQAGPLRRFKQARSLTAITRQMSWATLRRLRPQLYPFEARLAFVELVYGKTLANGLRNYHLTIQTLQQSHLTRWEKTLMLSQDLVEAITPVVAVLEQLGVDYLIGGSVASSILGIPRATNDADLVADLRSEHIAPFIAALQADYYLSEVALREALERKASFNLIHQPTMLKVDIFIAKNEPFDRSELSRRVVSPLVEESNAPLVNIASAEDMVLRKLAWYRAGGNISEKQWLDVLGILKMQAGNLDLTYLRSWALGLEVGDLLEKALEEADLA
jgi:hypothetical protein